MGNKLFWLLVTYLAIQSSLVSAQESCEQVKNFSLTGTVSILYPQLPGASNPSGNYTLAEYVYFSDDPASPYFPSNQTITALNSSGEPVLYDTFPYHGCAIFLSNLQHNSSNKDYINDGSENSCGSALSSGCMKQLVDYVNDTAIQMSQSNATREDACGNFKPLFVCQPAEFNSVNLMDLFHPHPNV